MIRLDIDALFESDEVRHHLQPARRTPRPPRRHLRRQHQAPVRKWCDPPARTVARPRGARDRTVHSQHEGRRERGDPDHPAESLPSARIQRLASTSSTRPRRPRPCIRKSTLLMRVPRADLRQVIRYLDMLACSRKLMSERIDIGALSQPARRAAMETGTDEWRRWGSASEHPLYVAPIPGDRRCLR